MPWGGGSWRAAEKPKRFSWLEAARERKQQQQQQRTSERQPTKDHYRMGRYDLVTATLHDKGYNVKPDVVASTSVYRGIDAELASDRDREETVISTQGRGTDGYDC